MFTYEKITIAMVTMIETSSDLTGKFLAILGYLWKFMESRKMFGNERVAFRQMFENIRKVVGNLRKIVLNIIISMLI